MIIWLCFEIEPILYRKRIPSKLKNLRTVYIYHRNASTSPSPRSIHSRPQASLLIDTANCAIGSVLSCETKQRTPIERGCRGREAWETHIQPQPQKSDEIREVPRWRSRGKYHSSPGPRPQCWRKIVSGTKSIERVSWKDNDQYRACYFQRALCWSSSLKGVDMSSYGRESWFEPPLGNVDS